MTCQFLLPPWSRNSQKRLQNKENQSKCRKLTRKPCSHVRILIFWMWVILVFCSWTGAEIEETWQEASRSMEKAGVGIGIINVNRSPRLADSLSVGRVPSIIGVLNGYVTFYSGTVTVRGLKDFVSGLFPSDLIQMVSFWGAKVIVNINFFKWQYVQMKRTNTTESKSIITSTIQMTYWWT